MNCQLSSDYTQVKIGIDVQYMEGPLPKDLRTFIAEVAERYPDEIKTVDTEVEPQFGITAVAARFEQQGRHPALFFPKVRNSRLPAVINLSAT